MGLEALSQSVKASRTMSLGSYLGKSPLWQQAAENLQKDYAKNEAIARSKAAAHPLVYKGRRGSMVVDVIASRQRKYTERVLGHIVPRFEAAEPTDLKSLAVKAPHFLPLRSGEAQTMADVAAGLLEFAKAQGIPLEDEELICREWADSVESIRHAPGLDPYVGSVSGVGVALFAYLRMRSGASAIKPDIRVRNALAKHGAPLPKNPNSSEILLAAEGLAEIVGVDLIVLDQLLW